MSDTAICTSCRKPQTVHACAVCGGPVCKKCAQSIADDRFVRLEKIADAHAFGKFCGLCYDREIAPRIATFQDTLASAEKSFVFFTTQKKPVPVIRRSKEKIELRDYADRDELILSLAYYAARDGFNAVMDADITSKKVRDESKYQTSAWRGSGYGALVDAGKLDRREARGED